MGQTGNKCLRVFLKRCPSACQGFVVLIWTLRVLCWPKPQRHESSLIRLCCSSCLSPFPKAGGRGLLGFLMSPWEVAVPAAGSWLLGWPRDCWMWA